MTLPKLSQPPLSGYGRKSLTLWNLSLFQSGCGGRVSAPRETEGRLKSLSVDAKSERSEHVILFGSDIRSGAGAKGVTVTGELLRASVVKGETGLRLR